MNPAAGAKGTVRYRRLLDPAIFQTAWAYVDHLVLTPGSATATQALSDIGETFYVVAGAGRSPSVPSPRPSSRVTPSRCAWGRASHSSKAAPSRSNCSSSVWRAMRRTNTTSSMRRVRLQRGGDEGIKGYATGPKGPALLQASSATPSTPRSTAATSQLLSVFESAAANAPSSLQKNTTPLACAEHAARGIDAALLRQLPGHASIANVDGPEHAFGRFVGYATPGAPHETLAGHPFGRRLPAVHAAAIVGLHVEQAGRGIV